MFPTSCCRSAKEMSLECRRTVLCYQSAFVGGAGNQSESRMLELGTAGLMSGEEKQPVARRPRSSLTKRRCLARSSLVASASVLSRFPRSELRMGPATACYDAYNHLKGTSHLYGHVS